MCVCVWLCACMRVLHGVCRRESMNVPGLQKRSAVTTVLGLGASGIEGNSSLVW